MRRSIRALLLLDFCSWLAVAVVSFLIGGHRAFVSSSLAFASYVLPSALLLTANEVVGRVAPIGRAGMMLAGLVVRTILVMCLMLASVMLYAELNWPAFLISLFVAVCTTAASQVFVNK